MKPITTVSALFALICSSSAFAANLKIPMAFEYLALDGTQIETNHFTHKSDLSLTSGKHKIAIRYSDMYEDRFSESPNFVKSSPFIVTINVEQDANYELKPASKITDPEAYAKDPKVVISSNGNQVDYQVQQTDIQENSFISRLFNVGEQSPKVDVAAVAITGGKPVPQPVKPASEVETMTATSVAATAEAPSKASEQSPNQSAQMLQYWWQQADEKTRKEFMSWAIKQL
ncbi:DUF2057 domain-containing protein [Shewanella sp. A3A]|nr:DUF2057 domain-containing protein [Shewanella ferrihydritica]